jgi:hypothetical protein
MPTTVTHSIGTASRDYATITLWAASIPVDLVVLNSVYKGECYNDSIFTDANVVIDCPTASNATCYPILSVAAGQRHNGIYGTGSTLDSTTASSTVLTLAPTNNGYAVLEWLCVTGGYSSYGVEARNYSMVHHCIVQGTENGGIIAGVSGTDRAPAAYRNIVYNITNGAAITAWESALVYNNTALAEFYIFAAQRGSYDAFDSHPTFKNNIGCQSGTNDYVFYFNAASTNNLSEDSTSPGANPVTGASPASLFTNPGADDYSLKAGAAAIGAGLNLTGAFDQIEIDIRGHTSPATGAWDIGADKHYTPVPVAIHGIPIHI